MVWQRPRTCIRCAAGWGRIRPSRPIRGPTRNRRCPTSRRSPTCAPACRGSASIPIRCRSASISTAGSPRDARPWDAHPHSRRRQDGCRDSGARPGAPPPERAAEDRLARDAARPCRQGQSHRFRRLPEERRGALRQSPKLVVLSAGAVQSAVLLLRSTTDRYPKGLANSLRPGRPQLHEPQLLARCSRCRPPIATPRSTRRPSASTITISATARAARRSATSSCSGRISGAILKANMPLVPEWLLDQTLAACHRLLRHERGHAESRKPHDGRRRAHRPAVEAHQLGRRI